MAGYGWLYLAAFERTHHDRKKPLHLYMQLLRCADSAPCKRTCRRILFYLRKIRATFDLAGSDPILATNGGVVRRRTLTPMLYSAGDVFKCVQQLTYVVSI